MATPNNIHTDSMQQFQQLMKELKKKCNKNLINFWRLLWVKKDSTECVVKKLRVNQGYTINIISKLT